MNVTSSTVPALRVPFVDLPAQHRSIAPEVEQAIQGVIARSDFVLGEAVARFEEEFAKFCGAQHAVGVGSGLAALELALRAFGIGPGDEVITTANTYVATALAIMAVGARTVLVDVDPGTYNMEAAALAAAITPRTRAVIPVHLYGQPVDLDPILEVAHKNRLVVIEDACQAHGARYAGRRTGTFGHAAAFSFYPAKNLGACGDGGMVTTNDPAVAEKVRRLRNYGERVKYEHVEPGTNSRLDTLQAAILRIKLRHLDEWNARRREHAASFDALLARLPVQRPCALPRAEHVYHLYVIQVEQRDAVKERLQAEGISTGIHYPIPVHLQEACAGLGYTRGAFPVTERAAGRILSLPMYAELRPEQREQVAAALGRALAGLGIIG